MVGDKKKFYTRARYRMGFRDEKIDLADLRNNESW